MYDAFADCSFSNAAAHRRGSLLGQWILQDVKRALSRSEQLIHFFNLCLEAYETNKTNLLFVY